PTAPPINGPPSPAPGLRVAWDHQSDRLLLAWQEEGRNVSHLVRWNFEPEEFSLAPELDRVMHRSLGRGSITISADDRWAALSIADGDRIAVLDQKTARLRGAGFHGEVAFTP